MVRFAAFLLRWAGCRVEYRVQRLRPNKTGELSTKDGTTLLRTESFSEAKAKMKKVRLGDDQTITIRLVAKVALRTGGVTIIGKHMSVDYDVDRVNEAARSAPLADTSAPTAKVDPFPDMDSDDATAKVGEDPADQGDVDSDKVTAP